jgi:hypothetical protein
MKLTDAPEYDRFDKHSQLQPLRQQQMEWQSSGPDEA